MGKHETVRRMTSGQIKDLIATVVGGVPTNLSCDEARQLTGKKSAIVAGVEQLLRDLANQPTPIIHHLSASEGLILSETDGRITLANADHVFDHNCTNPNLETWNTNVTSMGKGAIAVSVYELQQNATFVQMFTALSSELDLLVLTQDQIITFCQEHKDWLRNDGYYTFFLFNVRNELFVAGISYSSKDSLTLHVHRFEDEMEWSSYYRPRVITPKL